MKEINKVIVRLDAGNLYGLGHLSRCISIISKIYCNKYLFIIKTDHDKLVLDFLNANFNTIFEVVFLSKEITIYNDINVIESNYRFSDLLIVDHYEADENYQLQLYEKNIKWLQLDSHAKVKFYANWVMHGSPGATLELYEPLRKNVNTKFLLGPEYCIIKENVLKLGEKRHNRRSLEKVIICFGGGDDRGATIRCIESIDFEANDNLKFYVSISPYNFDYEKVVGYEDKGFIEIIDRNELHLKMNESDLAIVAPGMISYESAYLGLPMILVTIADNQIINAKAWESYGCGISLGSVEELNKNLNNTLSFLKTSLKIFSDMSENCLKIIDGKGVKRIVDQVTK